jgi:voltage-gated potassium channel
VVPWPGMTSSDSSTKQRGHWRDDLRIVIFEADTPSGKVFDIGLLWAILLSVAAVMLESVSAIRAEYGTALRVAEWSFTTLFTIEYVIRLICVPHPLRYAVSFFGVVDFLAVLPTYLSLIIPGSQSLLVIRALRLLRVARVLKLAHFLGEIEVLAGALRASRNKVVVFMATIVILVTILGSAMYLIEGEQAGFTSIPRSVYWAIVTMTTVGYGDITPQSVPGQTLAAIVMILGYAIIAVPTGIVTAEIVEAARNKPLTSRTCMSCLSEGHLMSARYCRECGARFDEPEGPESATEPSH